MHTSLTRITLIAVLSLALGIGLQAAGGPGWATQTAVREPAPRWSPPLLRPLEVSGHYRAPEHRYGPGHRGLDVPASPGEAITAPASGTITFAGRVVDRDVVTIRVDEQTLLSIEPVASDLGAGEVVQQGALLGTITTGGHCDGECVHLGVRIGAGREYVNPLRFYLDKPVLLPW